MYYFNRAAAGTAVFYNYLENSTSIISQSILGGPTIHFFFIGITLALLIFYKAFRWLKSPRLGSSGVAVDLPSMEKVISQRTHCPSMI